MTEFQRMFREYYLDLRERCRNSYGFLEPCDEDTTFQQEFGLPSSEEAGCLLNAVHCQYWETVEDYKNTIWTEYMICIESILLKNFGEKVII